MMINKKPVNKTKNSVNVQPQWLPWWRYLIWFFVIIAFSWFWSSPAQNQSQRFSYTEFKDKVRANEVTSVTLQGDRVSGNLRQLDVSTDTIAKTVPLRFVTTLPPVDDPELISLLEQHRVEINASSEQVNWWIRGLIGILPWILIIGLFWYSRHGAQCWR